MVAWQYIWHRHWRKPRMEVPFDWRNACDMLILDGFFRLFWHLPAFFIFFKIEWWNLGLHSLSISKCVCWSASERNSSIDSESAHDQLCCPKAQHGQSVQIITVIQLNSIAILPVYPFASSARFCFPSWCCIDYSTPTCCKKFMYQQCFNVGSQQLSRWPGGECLTARSSKRLFDRSHGDGWGPTPEAYDIGSFRPGTSRDHDPGWNTDAIILVSYLGDGAYFHGSTCHAYPKNYIYERPSKMGVRTRVIKLIVVVCFLVSVSCLWFV